MQLAGILIPLIGQLVQACMDAYQGSKADAAAALTRMETAIASARAAIDALHGELAANDAKADAQAAAKP